MPDNFFDSLLKDFFQRKRKRKREATPRPAKPVTLDSARRMVHQNLRDQRDCDRFRWLFSTPAGRDWMTNLFSADNIHSPACASLEGARQVIDLRMSASPTFKDPSA